MISKYLDVLLLLKYSRRVIARTICDDRLKLLLAIFSAVVITLSDTRHSFDKAEIFERHELAVCSITTYIGYSHFQAKFESILYKIFLI